MNKAFTKESDGDAEDDLDTEAGPALPPGAKNYITPVGYARLKDEFLQLMVARVKLDNPGTLRRMILQLSTFDTPAEAGWCRLW